MLLMQSISGRTMSNILLVTSSIFGENSKSRAVAHYVLERLEATDPTSRVTVRETNAIPHFSGELLGALMTPAEKRNTAQQRMVAFADTMIAEVEAADTIVIAAPMYNFTIPSTLKAWVDHIARAGRTFRYTEKGPEGLLRGKKVYVAASRGGLYANGGPAAAMDFQEPYLRAMLGFLGLSDVTFLYAEGQSISPDAAAAGMRKARESVTTLLPEVRAAA
jgi:FMN-dependent NADH-azoreductase